MSRGSPYFDATATPSMESISARIFADTSSAYSLSPSSFDTYTTERKEPGRSEVSMREYPDTIMIDVTALGYTYKVRVILYP